MGVCACVCGLVAYDSNLNCVWCVDTVEIIFLSNLGGRFLQRMRLQTGVGKIMSCMLCCYVSWSCGDLHGKQQQQHIIFSHCNHIGEENDGGRKICW